MRRRAAGTTAPPSPSSPPARPTSSPRTSACRRTSRRRSRSASHGARRSSTSAASTASASRVMAGAGFDARMIARRRRRAEGPLRAPRLRVDGRQEPARPTPSDADPTSTASTWFGGKASCVLVGNVGTMIGGIEAFDGRASGRRPARGRRRHRRRRGGSGCARSPAPPSATPTTSPFVADDDGAKRSESASTARSPYELDGGDRDKVKKLRIEVSPARSASPCPAEAISVAGRQPARVCSQQAAGRPPPRGPLREIVTRAARSSSSSTAIELSNVGAGGSCQSRRRRRDARRAGEPARDERSGRDRSALIARRCVGASGLRNGEQTTWYTRLDLVAAERRPRRRRRCARRRR